MWKGIVAGVVWSLVGAGYGLAQPWGRHVEVSLVAETDAVKPGSTLVVGLHLRMDPGWHTYWRNPGDAGLPTKVAWELPDGFEASPLQWPHPIRFKTGELVSFGYEHEVLLPSEIRVPSALSSEQVVVLEARASWLECEEVCLPGKATLTLRLPVRSIAQPGPAAPLFAAAREAMPRRDDTWRFAAAGGEGTVSLTVTPPSPARVREAYFYPLGKRVIDPSKPQAVEDTERGFRLQLDCHRRAGRVARLEGVLVATTNEGDVALEVDVPVETTSAAGQPADAGRSLASSSQGGSFGLHSSR